MPTQFLFLFLFSAAASGPTQAQNTHLNPDRRAEKALEGFEAQPVDEAMSAQAAAAVARSRDLQFERPTEAAKLPEPVTRERRPPRERGYKSPFGGALQALGPVAQVVFFGGLAVIAALIVWQVVRSGVFRGRFGNDDANGAGGVVDDTAIPERPEEALARARLEEADALAAAGRFGEAVHVLLFRSIEDIEAQRKRGLARSLTSREITRMEEISARARSALSPIAALVEKAIFGGRELARSDYDVARSAYSDFAFGGAAA